MIGRILRATDRGRTVIFTKTKRDAARVAEELVNRGFAAAPLHGDLNQVAREQALKAFRYRQGRHSGCDRRGGSRY